MKKASGFTLIELFVVMIIGGILLTLVFGEVSGATGKSSYSWGLNGMSETRCISGYQFVVGQNGSPTQILDNNGKGVACK